MRILSLRVAPVARIFAILYGVLSPLAILVLMLSKPDYVRIPLGIVAPLVHLNFNFDIQTPTHFFTGILLVLFGIVCYIATGWLTGAALVLAFNFVSRRLGGIEANIMVSAVDNRSTVQSV